ncbi:MAG: LamB/YcsF family protein [Chloroflexi bacterium]|nr:LamB/YcsF family protein [Chloroflexota bacterium]
MPDPTGVIDFNCDMGESFGSYEMKFDREIVRYVSSINVATGFHAGDPNWMRASVDLAAQHDVAVGAHPAYPDLVGFGRRDMTLSPAEVKNAVTYQIGALTAFTAHTGKRRLQHVKPHGAMYNKAVRDPAEAAAIIEAIREFDPELIHVVLAGSPWERLAREAGVPVAREAYSDRAITPEGTLVPRSQPGAVIHEPDEVVARVLKIATEGRVVTVNGDEIPFEADTICLHGDNPGAVEIAAAVREALDSSGIAVKPMAQIVT